MTAISRRSRIATASARTAAAVERLVAERAARDLVALAQELLLLDPGFESAFPRERTRASAPGVAAAARRVLQRDRFARLLPGPLRADLESLLAPPPRAVAPPARTMAATAAIADAALRTAAQCAPRASAPHLVRAQRCWVIDGSREKARSALDRAIERAAAPGARALALLHRAILQADEGGVDEAVDLLIGASRCSPPSLAVAWSLVVYAVATGRRRLVAQQLPVVARTADGGSLRRRALALHHHLQALARLGVLTLEQARTRADRLLATLPPLPGGET